MIYYTNESEALELTLEREYLIRRYEVITLPSFTRNMVAFDALKYASLLFDNRKAFNQAQGISLKHFESLWAIAEFDWYCKLASNSDFNESELRVVAVNAYVEFLRSQQILESLQSKKQWS